MEKNRGHKVHDEMRKQGKVSEKRILIVMTALIVIILALNWVAYHSVEVEMPVQEMSTETQQTAHSSEFKSEDF